MFTRDFELAGFSAQDWLRLRQVFRGPLPDIKSSSSRGGIIGVTSEGRLCKLLHTETGRIAPQTQAWPVSLEQLCQVYGARWAVCLELGALEELMHRFGARLALEQTYLEQLILVFELVKDLEAQGAVSTWPRRLSRLPAISKATAERGLDMLCPEGKILLLGVFSRGRLFTAVAARRRGLAFDKIAGPELLRTEMGLLSGDWRRDHRHLARAAAQIVGPLAVGCYGTLWSFQRLAVSQTPGSWASAVAARDIILSPIVPALTLPLGLDAGRAAVSAVRDLLVRLGVDGIWEGQASLRPALERLQDLGSGYDLRSAMGFDPLRLIARLFTWLSRSEKN